MVLSIFSWTLFERSSFLYTNSPALDLSFLSRFNSFRQANGIYRRRRKLDAIFSNRIRRAFFNVHPVEWQISQSDGRSPSSFRRTEEQNLKKRIKYGVGFHQIKIGRLQTNLKRKRNNINISNVSYPTLIRSVCGVEGFAGTTGIGRRKYLFSPSSDHKSPFLLSSRKIEQQLDQISKTVFLRQNRFGRPSIPYKNPSDSSLRYTRL